MTIVNDLEQLKATLIQQRDELALQVGLAKLELKDEWDELEEKTSHFMASVAVVSHDMADDIVHGTQKLGAELQSAYQQFKEKLQS